MSELNPSESDLVLGPSLFKSLIDVMSDPSFKRRHPNIAFGGKSSAQQIPIVGESFRQEEVALFKEGTSFGFLVPDQQNEFDKNAVALYLIKNSAQIHKVGHLPKALAAVVSQPIADLLANEQKIIPVSAKVFGGTREKPIMGVFAIAMTKSVKLN